MFSLRKFCLTWAITAIVTIDSANAGIRRTVTSDSFKEDPVTEAVTYHKISVSMEATEGSPSRRNPREQPSPSSNGEIASEIGGISPAYPRQYSQRIPEGYPGVQLDYLAALQQRYRSAYPQIPSTKGAGQPSYSIQQPQPKNFQSSGISGHDDQKSQGTPRGHPGYYGDYQPWGYSEDEYPNYGVQQPAAYAKGGYELKGVRQPASFPPVGQQYPGQFSSQLGKYPGRYGQNPGQYSHLYGQFPGQYSDLYGQNAGLYYSQYGQNPGHIPFPVSGKNPGQNSDQYGLTSGQYSNQPGQYRSEPGPYPGQNEQYSGQNVQYSGKDASKTPSGQNTALIAK